MATKQAPRFVTNTDRVVARTDLATLLDLTAGFATADEEDRPDIAADIAILARGIAALVEKGQR